VSKRLYVGNLPYSASEESLRELFAQYGEVNGVDIATDRDTRQPRGFGFVEMATDAGAEAAIQNLDGHDLGGRTIKVNEARPRPEGSGRSGGGRGGYGERRGGYGGRR